VAQPLEQSAGGLPGRQQDHVDGPVEHEVLCWHGPTLDEIAVELVAPEQGRAHR
jgi:hypothetical protein